MLECCSIADGKLLRVSERRARRYSSAIGRPAISNDNTTACRCNEWRECMFRTALLVVLVSTAVPLGVLAQTPADLKNDANTPDDVLVYGMGYSGQRYRPLTQINKQNVSKLVPIWSYSLADLNGGESFPVVKDGVIYVTTHNTTAAVDALTGKQIWRVIHEYPPDSRGLFSRSFVKPRPAIYEVTTIRAPMDDRAIALDTKT